MMPPKLTRARGSAILPGMGTREHARGRRAAVLLAMMAATAAIGGCVSVKAPDKPIVIELNINIRQEVIYRLADDVKNNIDENPEIF